MEMKDFVRQLEKDGAEVLLTFTGGGPLDGQVLSSDSSDPKEREEAFIMAVLFGVGKGVNERSEE